MLNYVFDIFIKPIVWFPFIVVFVMVSADSWRREQLRRLPGNKMLQEQVMGLLWSFSNFLATFISVLWSLSFLIWKMGVWVITGPHWVYSWLNEILHVRHLVQGWHLVSILSRLFLLSLLSSSLNWRKEGNRCHNVFLGGRLRNCQAECLSLKLHTPAHYFHPYSFIPGGFGRGVVVAPGVAN